MKKKVIKTRKKKKVTAPVPGVGLLVNLRDKLTVIGSIILIFGALFGAWAYMQSTFAQKRVESKLDYLNYNIQVNSLNDQITKLMTITPDLVNAPVPIKEQLKILSDRKDKYDRLIKSMDDKGLGIN